MKQKMPVGMILILILIGWYIVSMFLWLINLLSFMANNTMYDEYYKKILTPEMATLVTSSARIMTY